MARRATQGRQLLATAALSLSAVLVALVLVGRQPGAPRASLMQTGLIRGAQLAATAGVGLAPQLAAGNLAVDKSHTETSPAERAIAALKDTHLFWGPALQLDNDDGTKPPKPWRDADHNLQAMANNALDFCDELKNEESNGEEAVDGQGQGRTRRCVHHVVDRHDTRFVHTPAGINDWTQPLRDYDMDGEAGNGPEHNHAITLMKVIDQFKPRTEWDGQKIYENGVMVAIPTYDSSASTGFRGASREANLLFGTSAGNRKFNDFTMDSDMDTSGDESYDQVSLDAEKMIWGKEPGFEEAHVPKPSVAQLRAATIAAAKNAPRATLVKHKIGEFTVWQHKKVAPQSKKPASKRTVEDPLMSKVLREQEGRPNEITHIYGPDAPRVVAEQVPTAADKQSRLQNLWEVLPTINVGATPQLPPAQVITQTQSVITPGAAYYYTPPAGSNGFAMTQPYPIPAAAAGGYPIPGAAVAGVQCGQLTLPPCAQGVVVPGSSAITYQAYTGYAQWMQPPPLQYAQLPPPPVYMNKVTSSITSTTQSPPASVTQVQTVDQPWAAASGLPAETNIIEEETEIPEVETDPNKFHVHVEGLPTGCSSGAADRRLIRYKFSKVGGAQEWEGELNVEEVKCPTGAPRSDGRGPEATLGGWERGDYVGGWD